MTPPNPASEHELKLLVEREPWHRSFVESLRPALSLSSGRPFVQMGSRPAGPFVSTLVHAAALSLLVWLAPSLQPTVTPKTVEEIVRDYEPIFYMASELPEVNDMDGAESGRSGYSGGQHLRAPQIIRVARGASVSDTVVHLTDLKVEARPDIANLIVQKFEPAPVSGPERPEPIRIRSSRPAQAAEVVLPPQVRVPLENAKLELPVERQNLPTLTSSLILEKDVRSNLKTPGKAVTAKQIPEVAAPAIASSFTRDQVRQIEMIISSAAAGQIGSPGHNVPGVVVLSPSGGSRNGAGGNGSGSGIGNGAGPGSGNGGLGPGSGSTGTGMGNSMTARGGISPGSGPGGAGSGTGRPTGIRIVGSNVYVPSFSTGGAAPAAPYIAQQLGAKAPAVVIIASPRAGGTVKRLANLNVHTVYTIYLDTGSGTAVMQFGQSKSTQYFDQELRPPEPVQVDLPAQFKRMKFVVRCVLDRFGQFRKLTTVEASNPNASAALLGVLEDWRFRPAFRDDESVEVEVLLGLGVTTD